MKKGLRKKLKHMEVTSKKTDLYDSREVVELKGEYLDKIGLRFITHLDWLDMSHGRFQENDFVCHIKGDFWVVVDNKKIHNKVYVNRIKDFINSLMGKPVKNITFR